MHGEGEVTVKVYLMVLLEEEWPPTTCRALFVGRNRLQRHGRLPYDRLNSMLLADEDAAQLYATHLRMHGLLLWHWRDADVSAGFNPPGTSPTVVETSASGHPGLACCQFIFAGQLYVCLFAGGFHCGDRGCCLVGRAKCLVESGSLP